MRVAVITGTIGNKHLKTCVQSVLNQKLQPSVYVEHWIVIDGPQYKDTVYELLGDNAQQNSVKIMVLPENTGADGWNAHRIYGSLPYLVNTEYVCFLDEDNEFEPDHMQGLIDALGRDKDNDWAYSLRSIINNDGEHICNDCCESLGSISPTVCGTNDILVDANCFMLHRNLAISTSMVWNAPARPPHGMLEVDRALTNVLIKVAKLPHGVSRAHSVKYRVASTARSVTADFFTKGNMKTQFDAQKPDLYLFLLNNDATKKFFETQNNTDRSYALDEWQPTLCRRLGQTFNLFNAYENLETMPKGAKVLVVMWHPTAIPMMFLKGRPDLKRCVYTLESPNIRHRDQWDSKYLAEHFDIALTYWLPLIQCPPRNMKTYFCPHNCHHLDFDNPLDTKQLRNNASTDKSVAIVLERRGLQGDTYTINDTLLKCLDPLREKYVVGLKDITCYGIGWEKYANDPVIKIGHTLHRSKDPKASVDILQTFTFALIVENVNADGYVSEKLYDALMAGCIPLYYGNVVPELKIPSDVYVDLRQYKDGHELQDWIDSLSQADIQVMKNRVVEARGSILENVSCRAFADIVKHALDA